MNETRSKPSRDATLWVIDPSVAHAEDQGVQEILRGWPGRSRVFRPALSSGDGPQAATGYDADGIVVMGSASSVHDEPAWAVSLSAWLRPVLDGEVEIPLLGICYGHQLIAHLAGGDVEFIDGEKTKHLGVEATELEAGCLLPGRHELRVVVSHRERVARCPERYRVVARRAVSPIDGIEHEELPVFSFQFHPEAREDFASSAGIEQRAIDSRVREDSQRLLGAFRSRVLDGRS